MLRPYQLRQQEVKDTLSTTEYLEKPRRLIHNSTQYTRLNKIPESRSKALYKMQKLLQQVNSNLILLEGSNKWTPRKLGIQPTEVGNPTRVTGKPGTTHLQTVSKMKKINFKRKERTVRRAYLTFKLWTPPAAPNTSQDKESNPFLSNRHQEL
jgi:hypothetical protein